VILSRPIYFWSFADYVEGAQNPIQNWYASELSEAARFQFDSVLKNTAKIQNQLQWGGSKLLKGEPKKYGIWQLDFNADGRQYRVLGVFQPGHRAVLLIGCYHKGRVYTPHNALETACKRAKKLIEKRATTIDRQIDDTL
jgi:hypothetical protein